jgi:uncharacterized protein
MNITFPYDFDERGKTATSDYAHHIRELIEQVLFTSPGERVNRPSFGTNVRQLVFAPASGALAATTQSIVHGALQQYLGEYIAIDHIEAMSDNASLRVEIVYRIRKTQQSISSMYEYSL